MGMACREASVNSLLLAHHDDDQAETVFMRVAQGGIGVGLRGITPVNDIPECFGLYGVHQSGALRPTPSRHGDYGLGKHHSRKTNFVGLEDGGIKVLRPLLQFSKERLIATCLKSRVPWVEDETNKDPTLTMRNAVRHIFHNHRLPAALTKENLLVLSSREAERMDKYQGHVKSLFNKCDLRLEPRSGTIAVRFPTGMFTHGTGLRRSPSNKSRGTLTSEPSASSDKESATEEANLVATMLVQRLIEMITPQEKVPLKQLRHVPLYSMFPSLASSQSSEEVQQDRISNFACSSVYFRREQPPGPPGQTTWRLSRTPYRRGTTDEVLKQTILVPPHSDFPDSFPRMNFHLFDGRFWIRVSNPTPHPLVVRPFCGTDLKAFTASLLPHTRSRFLARLDKVAPRDVRWTLPVIAMAEQDHGATENEGHRGSKAVDPRGKVIAVPTLGVCIDGLSEEEHWVKELGWTVRFRKVNLGSNGPKGGRSPISRRHSPVGDEGTRAADG